jgi:hypothetical protein
LKKAIDRRLKPFPYKAFGDFTIKCIEEPLFSLITSVTIQGVIKKMPYIELDEIIMKKGL